MVEYRQKFMGQNQKVGIFNLRGFWARENENIWRLFLEVIGNDRRPTNPTKH